MGIKIDAIDLFKFLGSILIFMMHCNTLGDYPSVQVVPDLLARWGVPFFFICSAYFLFGKGENGNIDKETLRKYVIRIGMLYALWFLYNLPNVAYQRLYSKGIWAVSTWLKFLKSALLSSTFTGSWYLTSSIFSAWFVYTLAKRFSTKAIMGICSVFYLVCVMTSAYYGLLPSSVAKVLDFLCFPTNLFAGCFYFSLGKYIAENQASLFKRFSKKASAFAFAAFYLLFLFELYLTTRFGVLDGTDMAFSIAGAAVFLLLFCLRADLMLKNGSLLRKLSTIIYCCQGNVLLVNGVFKKVLGIPSVVAFLMSSCIVAAICILVLLIQKKGVWKWSKYLT